MVSRMRTHMPAGKASPPGVPARGRDPVLPRERGQLASDDHRPDPVMEQAYHDIERGLVDTDLHATPGLDAARRRQLLQRSRKQSEALALARRAKKPSP